MVQSELMEAAPEAVVPLSDCSCGCYAHCASSSTPCVMSSQSLIAWLGSFDVSRQDTSNGVRVFGPVRELIEWRAFVCAQPPLLCPRWQGKG